MRRFFVQKKETGAERPTRRGRIRLLLLIALLLAAGLPTGWLVWRTQAQGRKQVPTPTGSVTRADLALVVEASGTVAAARTLELPFGTVGQVREVLVAAGAQVAAGQPLARLDERELLLAVQQAEADLQTAQAEQTAATGGGATLEEIAQAEAGVAAAAAQAEQTRSGNTTAADLQAAQARVDEARARLDALQQPANDKISAARLALAQAQGELAATRDSASATKTRAEQEMLRAADTLTEAQSAYATALQQWQHVQETGTDPINPTENNAQGDAVENDLNDAQRQQYYDAYVRAEAAMRSAERAVAQARVAYDSARQQEAVAVETSEAKLADAQAQLDGLLNPSASVVAQAEASLREAEAQLAKLRAGGTRAQRSEAGARLAEAQARLAALTAPAAAPDQARAAAGVAQAEAKLAAARLARERATLTAPFSATVATVGIVPGSSVGASSTAFTLVDTSTVHLDLAIGESDIARIKVGQPVAIDFETLPGRTFTGSVTAVATMGEESQGVVTYRVAVAFDPGDAPVKLGMTASASIEVERRANVIQVPNRAITTQGPIKTVQLLYGEARTPVTVVVQTGATDGTRTEVIACVDTGSICLREGDALALNLPGGAATGGLNGFDQIVAPPGGAMPAGGGRVIRIAP